MHDDGLRVQFYLPRLSDDDLQAGTECALSMYDHAPKFCGWLDDVLTNEKERRLRQRQGEDIEVLYLKLPSHEFSNTELTQALAVVTALSYKVPQQLLGEFIDKIVRTVVVAVGARLKQLEETYGTCATTV